LKTGIFYEKGNQSDWPLFLLRPVCFAAGFGQLPAGPAPDTSMNEPNCSNTCNNMQQLKAMNSPVTLQEFISHTKGIEYIIAILFLLVFPVFWKLLNNKKGP
jgi:hypothetical protein